MPQPDITLLDIMTGARRRADMVVSTFVTDPEAQDYAEKAWGEFWMLITSKFEDFFLTKTTISLTAGSPYNLPVDFLKLRGIRHANGEFLRRIDIKELFAFGDNPGRARPTHYYVRGSVDSAAPLLEFMPLPDLSYSMELFYTPFKSLEDAFAGSMRIVAVWAEYLTLSVAIKLKDKEESDCSVLIAEREMLLDLITKSMTPLDAGEPFAVVQTQNRLSAYADPFLIEDMLGG